MLAPSWRLLLGAVLLSSLATTPPASSQSPVMVPLPALTLTPYGGFQFGLPRTSALRLRSEGTESTGSLLVRTGGGALGGVQVAVPVDRLLFAPWAAGIAVMAGVAYGRDAAGDVSLAFDSVGTPLAQSAAVDLAPAGVLTARLGLGFQIPVAVPALLIVAPALVRMVPERQPTSALDRPGPVNHPGLSLGAEVSIPTHLRGLAIHLGAEDNLVFTGRDLEQRVDRFFLVETGRVTLTEVSLAPTHLVVLRAGLSMQF